MNMKRFTSNFNKQMRHNKRQSKLRNNLFKNWDLLDHKERQKELEKIQNNEYFINKE